MPEPGYVRFRNHLESTLTRLQEPNGKDPL